VSPLVRWALIATSIALATLTYRYVERPVRFGGGRWRTAATVVAMFALGIVGLRDFRAGGLFFPHATWISIANEGDIGNWQYSRLVSASSFACYSKFPHVQAKADRGFTCGQSAADLPPAILLLGYSHANQLYLGLSKAMSDRNVGYYTLGASPFLDDPQFGPLFGVLAKEPRIEAVLMTAYWSYRVKKLPKAVSLHVEMDKVVRFLLDAGKEVYLTNDIPAFSFRPGRCKYTGKIGVQNRCDEDEASLGLQLESYASDLEAVVSDNPGVHFIDIAYGLCSDTCTMEKNGKLLYRDDNHLNIYGSQFIGARIATAIREIEN
jgi:hypothetical protein